MGKETCRDNFFVIGTSFPPIHQVGLNRAPSDKGQVPDGVALIRAATPRLGSTRDIARPSRVC